MTYVELIVVLAIFSVLSAVVLFNYSAFQSKVDIKNLANDLAIRIVEAQKSALNGKLTTKTIIPAKPSYGIYFKFNSPGDRASFVTFANNIINDGLNTDFSDSVLASVCPNPYDLNAECTDKITLTRGNTISEVKVFYQDVTPPLVVANDISFTFTRPSGNPVFRSGGVILTPVSYVQITVTSPQSLSAKIKLYASGRVQIN